MTMYRLESLLNYQLEELYNAEVHVAKGFPRLIEGACSAELKSLLQQHAQDSEQHAASLSQALTKRGMTPHTGKSKVVDTLLKRALELAETRGDAVVLDIGLAYTVGFIKNYQRCAYLSASSVAEALQLHEVVKILEARAREEAITEQSFAVLGEDMIDSLQAEVSRRNGEPGATIGEVPVG